MKRDKVIGGIARKRQYKFNRQEAQAFFQLLDLVAASLSGIATAFLLLSGRIRSPQGQVVAQQLHDQSGVFVARMKKVRCCKLNL